MFKLFFSLVLLLTINIVYCPAVYGSHNSLVKQFLEEREQNWPNWNLSDLKFSNIKKDLIYPSWFEGEWIVYSDNIKDNLDESLIYKVNFYKNELGEVLGNRSENSESIGKALFGDRLEKVINDPKSFNDQAIYLRDSEFIESRITERNQIFDNDLFFADEFSIQTVHKPEGSRVNQIEVMSKFYKCKNVDSEFKDIQNQDICGFQYLATYGSKVGQKNIKAISQSKYKLTFKYLGKKH